MEQEKQMTEAREAYWAGYKAYQSGVSRYDNPHDDPELAKQWNQGWQEAAWDD
jgi:ribosome modulation factor